MPTYDYKCETDGYFEARQRMVDHARATCPTCEADCPQAIRTAPSLDYTAMDNAGMPGAGIRRGNDMYKRHTQADQRHRMGSKDKGDYMDQ